jgi:hypothetical protein
MGAMLPQPFGRDSDGSVTSKHAPCRIESARPPERIDAELKQAEEEIMRLLREVTE